jgi:SMODS-associated and fused to various effectors sensor domain/TIR domain
MTEALSAMVSYQWTDASAAELLHEELALRGLVVHHDRCSFLAGSRIGTEMDEAVASCDGFVAYLTPHSLYESSPAGSPRPAIDAEFKPAMDRLARSQAEDGGSRRPIIVPLTHGLGNPRTQAPERVRRATGKDISSLWTPVTLDQSTTSITQSEAAAVGRNLLTALLTPGSDPPTDDPIDVVVVTRGEGQPPAFLSVDGATLLGGATNRPGEPATWGRYLAALQDLQSVLARWTQRRQLDLRIRAHLSAAITFGRVFNQAAGWRPDIEGRHGRVSPSTEVDHEELKTSLDKGGRPGDLSVEIDLLNVQVSDLAAGTLMHLVKPATNRLCIWRERHKSDLLSEDVAAMASCAAIAVRDAVFDLRPTRTHVFCASPVEFAVLFGSRLTSLHTNLHLYERDGDRYVPSLIIPANE